jgi:hypothetical protein
MTSYLKVPQPGISVDKRGMMLLLVKHLLLLAKKKSMTFVLDASHQPLISPSEAAILESMMSGGSHLSLKAHFIDELPLLTPLRQTLTSLNLSYNSFKVR